ncbi:MAG: RNA pseudouridine synthase [Planctomycetia bacterium]|nr:RNA pseudouridine synthase [Planctomycetia bacterium]
MTAPTVDPAALAAARRRLAAAGVVVVVEDHLLLGVAKAPGVLSQPGPEGVLSLVELLGDYRRDVEGKPGRAFVGVVHRLDRNVSGALVVAKSSKAASRLSEAFRGRSGVEKTYLAWVTRGPAADAGALRGTLVRDDARRVSRIVGARDGGGGNDADGDGDGPDDGGREARLDFEVEARTPEAARLRIALHTGATHQIRAQCAAAGFPLLGDAKYGGPAGLGSARIDRPALHARRLVVPHPVGGAPVVIEAPLPDDLRRLDRALGLRPPAA